MTPPEFREALRRLELSQRGAARWFGVNLSTVSREWMTRGPSPPAEKLIRYALAQRMTAADVDRMIEASP